MRVVIDILIVTMLVALLFGTARYFQSQQSSQDRTTQVHRAMLRLHEQAVYHGAIEQAAVSDAGFPLEISPLWFGEHGVPVNRLVPGRQPWIDIAPQGDNSEHPPDPVITKPNQAGFWYNPNIGIIRARVAGNYSLHEALAWVTADGGHVHHNTFMFPGKWLLRILQETSDTRFKPCHGGVFENNLIVYDQRVRVYVNVGPRTDPKSFIFRRNAWNQVDGSRKPVLPTKEQDGIYQIPLTIKHPQTREMKIYSPDPRLADIGADAYKKQEEKKKANKLNAGGGL